MVHGRSGCGGDRRIARRWRILASTICAVVGLELGATEIAIADSRFSVLTFRIVKSYDYFFASRAPEEVWRLWSRSPIEPPVGLRYAGVRSDPSIAAVPPVLDLDPGLDVVALGPSGAIRARLGALAQSLEGTAVVSAEAATRQRPLLSTEADTSLAGTSGATALLFVSDPMEVADIQERFAGLSPIFSDEKLAAAPGPAPAAASDSMGGATLPTPLRIVATALESVAILACGRRTFRR